MAGEILRVLSGISLDPSSPVPLYHQAARALERAIEEGELPRGSKLPNELELAGELGISRPTMRQAIKQLVDKGLLVRRRGIGTIVAPRPVRRAVALTSLYDDLKAAGREPATRVLALEEVGCPPEVAERLGIGAGEPVIRLERLRLAEADPIALMLNFIPAGLLELRVGDLERGGLYELFRRAGVAPHVATQRIGARKAGAGEAELLQIGPGDPVLTMDRVAYDTAGRAIEYGSHRYPAESYSLEMMLVEV